MIRSQSPHGPLLRSLLYYHIMGRVPLDGTTHGVGNFPRVIGGGDRVLPQDGFIGTIAKKVAAVVYIMGI